MTAKPRSPDVVAEVVARVLATGATEFEVEYKDGEELVVAFNGAVGVGVAAFRSGSADAQELRRQLYALKKKKRKITHAGVEYALRVEIFDSFGEDAFRGTITKSKGKESMPKRIVRLEGELWRIRPDHGELDAAEQQELRDYFDEIRMPYRLQHGRLCVPGSISWEALYERLEHFYDGRAEVYPF
jgi:hypothetical protein